MDYLDDLNALYVYEAKMSLLIRVAQSRYGAERLLDARVLPTLGNCDFLDAQPEADQAFIGRIHILSLRTVLKFDQQIKAGSFRPRYSDTISFACLRCSS